MSFFYLQLVAIPYEGENEISFVIVLPKSKSSKSLTLLLKALKTSPDLLKGAMKKMKTQSLVLSIPKFRIQTKFDLAIQYRNVSQLALYPMV